MTAPPLRLAELTASLSLVMDLGTGQPMEWVIRCALLGVRLADALNLSSDERRDVYYLITPSACSCGYWPARHWVHSPRNTTNSSTAPALTAVC